MMSTETITVARAYTASERNKMQILCDFTDHI